LVIFVEPKTEGLADLGSKSQHPSSIDRTPGDPRFLTALALKGFVCEVLHKKRDLNKAHIEKLSKRFNVSPAVFFSLAASIRRALWHGSQFKGQAFCFSVPSFASRFATHNWKA
jgi:hypothetical protein